MLQKLYRYKQDTVYCGDNLEVLGEFPDECIDLIYIDPPFFSGKKYDAVFEDEWALQAFDDTFKLTNKDEESTKMEKYLNFMEIRIRELHRVLKSTGSFYLHCDWHANAYLRMVCDDIFGKNKLRSEIIWQMKSVSGFKSKRNGWIRDHDTILYYVKSKDFVFNKEYLPLRKEYIDKMFRKSDDNGLYRERKRKNKDGKIIIN